MKRPPVDAPLLMIIGAALLHFQTDARGAVIPVENTLTSWAYSADGEQEERIIRTDATAPFSGADTAVANATVSTTTYDFSPTATDERLQFEFDHTRNDNAGGFAMSEATLDFQVSQRTPFSVQAHYDYSGDERKFVFVRLFDNLLSTNDPVFDWTQTTESALPARFEFSDEGELAPGKTYRLQYRFMIDGGGGVNALAHGGLDFVIGDPVIPGTIGDANGDGRVDIDDLNSVRNRFGSSGPADGSLSGDTFPYDGAVDIDDLNAVRNHFGQVAAAPEPSAIVLAVLVACAMSLPRQRRRRLLSIG